MRIFGRWDWKEEKKKGAVRLPKKVSKVNVLSV